MRSMIIYLVKKVEMVRAHFIVRVLCRLLFIYLITL